MKACKRPLSALLLAAVFWNAPSSKGQEQTRPKHFALKAAPLPECKSFLIAEFGTGYRLSQRAIRTADTLFLDDTIPSVISQSLAPDRRFYSSADFGWMVNVSRRSAVGASLFAGFPGTGVRVALKPRYRHWFGSTTSLDLSPGIFLHVQDDLFLHKFPSFLGEVGLNFSNRLALTGRVEVLRHIPGVSLTQKEETAVLFYGGVRLGSLGALWPQPNSLENKAALLSILGTAVPSAIGGAYALVCRGSGSCALDEHWPIVVVAAGSGILFGPSLGYFYGGRPGRGLGGIGVRLAIAGGAAAVAGIIWSGSSAEEEDCGLFGPCFPFIPPASILILAAGGVMVVAHSIYDIVQVKETVQKHNRSRQEKALTVAPAYFAQHGAPGLKLQARF
ncbi:MAG: hypothetical protein L0196_06070 [candidate division Zixibacteria bacterium]|nr:hypothetical protein [candidate division Zixibacteria bacterium]